MNTAYPLFPISILVILFYSLSFTFSRIGILSKANHRQFWNALLLIAFLTTGLIGILMVVKINYKLVMPFYDQLVGYHVGFGIGMAVIGFFHFWWHLSYYLHLFRNEKNKETGLASQAGIEPDVRLLRISAFMLGSTSIIAQLILLREFLTVFNGNELVIGVVLANWMVITGIGAWLGKHSLKAGRAYPVVLSGLLFLSVLPFVTAFLINYLKNIVFPIGALISVFQIFFSSMLLLVPFCLLSGFLFTSITKSYSELRNRNETGSVYGYESVGSMAGGLLCGMLFIFVFSSIESLLVLAVVNGSVLFLISLKRYSRKLVWIPLIIVIPGFLLLLFQPEKRIRSLVYPSQEIEVSKDSPQGNIVITRRKNLWSVYNNNTLLFDSENFMMNEEAVHFAMLQYPDPKKVLLVSGGLSGQIAEIRKYGNISIDHVEDNPWLMAVMKDTLKKMTDEKLNTYVTDPLRFIRTTQKMYDVVLLNLPGPSTLQANRYYTIEFFKLIKKKLTPGAVLSFGLQAPPNYLNSEAVDLNSTLFATLKQVFQNVIVIPGEKNYFLASDGPLTYNIALAVQSKGLDNKYVNQYYFDDTLLKSRGEHILSALNPAAEINRNLNPISYHQQLAYWLSQFKGKYQLMGVVIGVLGLFVFFSGSTSSRTMFLTGFTATGMEILLLFGLQIFFGNIYLLTSFVFTGFMLGLAVGSFIGKSFENTSENKYLPVTHILIGGLVLASSLLFFFSGITELPQAVVYALYLIAILLIGGLTGFQFRQASHYGIGSSVEISGKTYSYDLFGSALGALTVSLYLVPKIGILASIVTISLVNLIFGLWLILRKNLLV